MDLAPLPVPVGLPIGLEALAGRTFDAVLFDMDGTLVDSTPSVVRCWMRWAELEGVDPALLGGRHGMPAASIVADVLPGASPERLAAAVARITALEVEDVEGIRVLPGAAEALEALRAGPAEHGGPARAAIATSCTMPLALSRIGATSLVAPDVLVTADQVSRGKPDPEPYRLAAERLGADPARCLVVEDAPAGLVSGRAAGCATLAVATTHTVEDLRASAADAIVVDLSSITFTAGPGGVTLTW